MIDDQVRHQVNILPQFFDICPASQAGIDPCVIYRIKAGVSAMNRIIKWENVNAAKQTGQCYAVFRSMMFRGIWTCLGMLEGD